MKHVFVETNWVFACCAPGPYRRSDAEELLAAGTRGEVRLHLPAICLNEAEAAIRNGCQPVVPSHLFEFHRRARLSAEEAASIERFFERYVAEVQSGLSKLPAAVDALATSPGVEAFPLNDSMLKRTLELRKQINALSRRLKPFDEAILGGILGRAAELRAEGVLEMAFCVIDSDLKPFDRHFKRKNDLAALYDEASMWVYGDFALSSPEKPSDWLPSVSRG